MCLCEWGCKLTASGDLYSLWYVKSHLPKSSSDCQIKLSCSSGSSVIVIGAQMLPSHVGSLKLNLTAITGPCKRTLCHLTCFRILPYGAGWYDLQKPLPQWQLETRRDTSCHASKSCLQHLSCTTSYSQVFLLLQMNCSYIATLQYTVWKFLNPLCNSNQGS